MCSSAESTRTARWFSKGRSGAPGSPGWNSPHARAVGVEEGQLPAPCVRAHERERLRAVDDVHPEIGGHELGDRIAIGDPVRDMVQLRRIHVLDVTQPDTGYARLLTPVDRPLELLLRHPRAT